MIILGVRRGFNPRYSSSTKFRLYNYPGGFIGRDLNSNILRELEDLKIRYFETKDRDDNFILKEKIQELFRKITKDSINFDFEVYFSEVFQGEKGFDVVIANPPYISYYSKQSKQLEEDIEKYFRSKYEFLRGKSRKIRINSIMFFLETGYNILRNKGVMSYIMDLNIYENPFEAIRKFISERMALYEIINDLTVFENVGSGQVILIAGKSIKEYNQVLVKNDLLGIPKIIEQTKLVSGANCIWSLRENQNLIDKIEEKTTPLWQLTELHTGVAVYATEEGKSLFLKKKGDAQCFPILIGGKSVGFPYCKPIPACYLLYDKKLERKLNEYFDKDYFNKHASHQRPFNIREINEYDRPKLIIRQSDIKITATYSDDLIFGNYSLFNAYRKDNDSMVLKFCLALLNSQLLTYYAIKKGIILIKPGKTPQIRNGQRGPIGIRQMPIKKILKEVQKPFIKLVDKILVITKDNDYQQDLDKKAKVKEYERQIDQMVYKLYELTKEEIEIVENYKKVN